MKTLHEIKEQLELFIQVNEGFITLLKYFLEKPDTFHHKISNYLSENFDAASTVMATEAEPLIILPPFSDFSTTRMDCSEFLNQQLNHPDYEKYFIEQFNFFYTELFPGSENNFQLSTAQDLHFYDHKPGSFTLFKGLYFYILYQLSERIFYELLNNTLENSETLEAIAALIYSSVKKSFLTYQNPLAMMAYARLLMSDNELTDTLIKLKLISPHPNKRLKTLLKRIYQHIPHFGTIAAAYVGLITWEMHQCSKDPDNQLLFLRQSIIYFTIAETLQAKSESSMQMVMGGDDFFEKIVESLALDSVRFASWQDVIDHLQRYLPSPMPPTLKRIAMTIIKSHHLPSFCLEPEQPFQTSTVMSPLGLFLSSENDDKNSVNKKPMPDQKSLSKLKR